VHALVVMAVVAAAPVLKREQFLPMGSSAQAVPDRGTVMSPSDSDAVRETFSSLPNGQAVALARRDFRNCVAWFARWETAGPWSWLLLSTKPDGTVVEPVVVAQGRKAKLKVERDGALQVALSEVFPDVDIPEGAVLAAKQRFEVGADCRVQRGPLEREGLSGKAVDAATREQLFIEDDGARLRVWYRTVKSPVLPEWKELEATRGEGAVIVRFAKGKPPYTLKWSADRKTLSSTAADAGVQTFTAP
jgi:hypothetical protein